MHGQKHKIVFRIIAVLLILFCVYWVVWRVSLMDNTSVKYLDDYRAYYFTTTFKPNTMPPPFGSSRRTIYFIPGLKGQMLKKVKKDVINALETLVEEHSGVFYKYEISDDFKQVLIYETPDGIGRNEFINLHPEELSRIESLTGLYHSVKKGGSASRPTDYIFDVIAADS